MPLRLEIKKKLTARSERVKSVDLHPTEPWVLSALYSGNVFVWDYSTGSTVKSFEVCELPVRCAKFIVRKSWFIAASDDMHLRVYNYNTMEKIKAWEAHMDYIRYVEVHPTLPNVLSASDDMTIKLWDWDKNWDCTQVFEGHAHYVMMVKFNLKDTSTFASASLDRSIKVWGLGSHTPHFSLEGHDKGVNCIDYYPGGDKPYLLSGADDNQVKIWDYQTKACVQTLDGHTHNVAAVVFHPRLPVIISGSEDGTVRIWHSTTYRAETTLNYGMERVWALAASSDSNKLAIGYDEGTIVIKLGQETPVASMDTNTGKLVWAVNNDIFTSSVKGVAQESEVGDGERLPIVPRDLGSCEIFPQSLTHNCNGRFIVVCGDGEFIIYTSQALRNKSFGSALDFCWSAVGTGDYAIRESISKIKLFNNFTERRAFKPPIASAEGLFGGHAIAVKGSDCVVFLDWTDGVLIRRIDVVPKAVYWNEIGEIVLIACDESFFVLKYNKEAVAAAIANGAVGEEGVEEAFELLHELADKVRTGQWVGDCFIYTNGTQRLQYYVGGQIMTLCHLDHPMYLLGYLAKEDRVFLMDKQLNIVSFKVLLSVLQYQTAVVRQDFEVANKLLPYIPETELSNVARFLESQGYKEEALVVSRDPDQKFELALDLKKLAVAQELLETIRKEDHDSMDTQQKWRKLGDLALVKSNFALAERCAWEAGDLSGLLLLYTSLGDGKGLLKLANKAAELGKANVSFTAYFLLGKIEECIELLIKTERIPEAAFLARTYLPTQIPRIVQLWKEDLGKVSQKAAGALAEPSTHPELFPDLDWAVRVEDLFKQNRHTVVPAAVYPQAKADLDLDLISLVKSQAAAGGPPPPAPPKAATPPPPPSVASPTSAAPPPPPPVQSGPSPRAVAQAEAAARAQQEAEAKARRDAEAAAAAEQARLAAAEQARLAAAEQARLAAAEQARLEAEAAQRRAAEEAAFRAQQEALRAQQEAEEKARREAALKAEREAQAAREAAAKREAEEAARREAEARAQAEEEARLAAEEEARRAAEEEAARLKAEADKILEDDLEDDW